MSNDKLDEILHEFENYIFGDASTKKPKLSPEKAKKRLLAWRDKAVREARIDELKSFKEYSYNLGFRGSGMEHLDRRITELNSQEKIDNQNITPEYLNGSAGGKS